MPTPGLNGEQILLSVGDTLQQIMDVLAAGEHGSPESKTTCTFGRMRSLRRSSEACLPV